MGPPPCFLQPQHYERNLILRNQIRAKLQTPIAQGYIGPGTVKSLTSYFSVPKGSDDIHMVYDATKSGHNDSLWVPSFSLPTPEAMTNLLTSDSWMGDLEIGEHFLNFPLSQDLQPYCGIDLRPYFGSAEKKKLQSWTRCMMGLVSSPYVTIKSTLLAYEVANGNWKDPKNAMQWDYVHMNLPGSPTYDP